MSVQKSFRLSDLSNAILEEIAERNDKTQTQVIEELLKDYVIFDMDPDEGQNLLKAAQTKLDTLKSKRD